MARKISRRIKTLRGFVAWAERFTDGKYLFRGVSKQSYKLEASAYRRLPEGDKRKPHEFRKVNRELLERARLLGHAHRDGQQRSDLELLAELQHFGAATCLIDFTRNAFIALWFACQQSASGDAANGKVFAVRVDEPVHFKTVTHELLASEDIDTFFAEDDEGRYPLYQWQPKHQNNRIIAQQSVFIFGGAQIDVAAECVIFKSSKRELLVSLEKLSGISEGALFPDFDGFARLNAQNRVSIQSDPAAYLDRAVEAHQEGKWDDALAYYDEVLSLKPDSHIQARVYTGRGLIYRSKEEFDLAIAHLTKAIELTVDDAHAYNNRGLAYGLRAEIYGDAENRERAVEDMDSAIKDYDAALARNPDFSDAYNNRGAAYLFKDEFELAIADCNEAITRNSNSHDAYYNRATAHLFKDEFGLAIEDYDRAVTLNADLHEAYYNRATAYSYTGELELAIEDYTKVVDLDADDANAYYSRGIVRLQLQNWQEAKADLTAAMQRDMDIIDAFQTDYESVIHFEQEHGIQLPDDIAELLKQK